eukprot:6270-Prorocentrum_minimum.AAC.4
MPTRENACESLNLKTSLNCSESLGLTSLNGTRGPQTLKPPLVPYVRKPYAATHTCCQTVQSTVNCFTFDSKVQVHEVRLHDTHEHIWLVSSRFGGTGWRAQRDWPPLSRQGVHVAFGFTLTFVSFTTTFFVRTSLEFLGNSRRITTTIMPYELWRQPTDTTAPVKHVLLPCGAWGSTCVLGRKAGECQVVIEGQGISRKHATITISTRPHELGNGSVVEEEEVKFQDFSRYGCVPITLT